MEAVQVFKREFGCNPKVAAAAPGRVNLIGEHTDYNGGCVLPMALEKSTAVVGRRTNSDVIRVYSCSVDDPLLLIPWPSPSKPLPSKPTDEEWSRLCKEKHWGNYVLGVLAQFLDLTSNLCPFDAVIATEVPLGGGVSSSASLEVAIFSFLEQLMEETSHSGVTKALRCQAAEHNYAKMPCGVMDQFVCTLAEPGHALLIDCREPYPTELVPLSDPDVVILVVNSNVRHKLVGGKATKGEYEERRRTCELVAELMGKKYLKEVTLEELDGESGSLSDTQYRRARHVITEIERTLRAVDCLKKNDYVQFGKLMMDSHKSLRDDYQVSCAELDDLVAIANGCRGVYGSRMTGGGFGGCTVTLVKKDDVEDCVKTIRSKYKEKFPEKEATCFTSTAGKGAGPVDLAPFLVD